MTDTAKLLASIARREAEARKLIADGFATKADQTRARELASRAYSDAKSVLREKMGWEVDVDLPYETNHFRPKHSAAALAACPAAADEIAAIERVVALYAEIKAAPIVPKPSKTQVARERVEALAQTINQALREQFMAQAPALAAEWDTYVRRVFTSYASKHGDGESVPSDLYPDRDWRVRLTDEQADKQATVNQVIRPHCDYIEGKPGRYTLNAEKLAVEAEKYGIAVAMQWFEKTNGKLGEMLDAQLLRDSGGSVRVTGTKADGIKVTMEQQPIIKWAPIARRAYHQFPARIYLNGKFTPFAAYAKTYGTSDTAD